MYCNDCKKLTYTLIAIKNTEVLLEGVPKTLSETKMCYKCFQARYKRVEGLEETRVGDYLIIGPKGKVTERQQMISKRHLAKVLWAALWLMITGVPAFGMQADQELQLGMTQFNAGYFQNALTHFSLAVNQSPDLALAHYYMAVSLEHLKRSPEAIEQYKACYNLEPTGTLGKYCQQALKNYALMKETAPEQLRQAASERDRANTFRSYSGSPADQQQLKQDLITNEEDELNVVHYDKYGRALHVYQDSEIGKVKDNLEQARISTSPAAQAAVAGANKMIQIESDLSSQMNSAAGVSDSVRLSPTGTNLHVRSYDSSPKEKSTEQELLATQNKLIVESHTKEGKSTSKVVPAPLAASEDQLVIDGKNSPGGSFAKLKVDGKLLE